jgi:hypothetical protein
MAVTCRGARRTRLSDGDRFSGQCTDCKTTYEVDIDPGDAIVVTVDGRTCRECNPGKKGLDRHEPLGLQVVTVLASKRNGEVPRVHTVVSEPAAGLESTKSERFCTSSTCMLDEVSRRTADVWQRIAEPLMTCRIGAEDWQFISDAWRPVHCSSLDVVADALDDIWATEVPEAGRTVLTVDLGGLPAIPAALLAGTATRSVTVSPGLSIAELGRSLRTLAAICCAARGFAARCAPLLHVLSQGTFALPVEAHVMKAVKSLPDLTTTNLTERIVNVRPAIPQPEPPYTPGQDSLAAASAMLAEAQRTPPVSTTFGR